MNVIIAAVDSNGVIGVDNKLPWHYPDDLKSFKRRTMNKMIVMGRKTYESIGSKLPGRSIVVASKTARFPNVLVTSDVVGFLNSINSATPVYIVGGASIYETCLPITKMMYITRIPEAVTVQEGQVVSKFPAILESEFERLDFETLESGAVVEQYVRV